MKASATMTPTPAELAKSLDELDEKIVDLKPVRKDIERITVDAIRRAFSTRGASLGAKWPPYKATYQRRKGRSQPDLFKTGALYRAATSGAKKTFRQTKTWQKLTYRVKSVYVGVQEFGWPKKNISARHTIFMTEGNVDKVMDVIDKNVQFRIEKFNRHRYPVKKGVG